MSNIVRLEAENIKRIRAVAIDFDEAGAIVIRGQNEQGKSSILDTVHYILGGKRVQPAEVIRTGEHEARGLLETDELIVERKWSSNETSQVEVLSRDGRKFKSPQAVLDKLYTRLTFDPLAFVKIDPGERLDQLHKIVGLDLSEINGRRLKFFDARTLANRDLEQLKARLQAAPPVETVERVDVRALLEAQRSLEATVAARAELHRKWTAATQLAVSAAEGVKAAEAALARAYSAKGAADKEAAAASDALNQAAEVTPSQRTAIGIKIASASEQNERAAAQEARARLADEVHAAGQKVLELNRGIEAIDTEKLEKVKAVKFPVPGLGFGDEGVTFNGLPFEQASQAQQIRVSVGIGFALNPGLKLLLVRDGSALDAKNLRLVGELAKEAGGHVLVEVVDQDERSGIGIVIVDGAIARINRTAEDVERNKGAP